MTFSFFYNLCFHMKIPISLQSFREPVFEMHVACSTTRSISSHPSLREASRKHQHNTAKKCITAKNVPHKVTAKRSSKRNAWRDPSRIIYQNNRRNYFFFGTVCILAPIDLPTDILPFGGGFTGWSLGWDWRAGSLNGALARLSSDPGFAAAFFAVLPWETCGSSSSSSSLSSSSSPLLSSVSSPVPDFAA